MMREPCIACGAPAPVGVVYVDYSPTVVTEMDTYTGVLDVAGGKGEIAFQLVNLNAIATTARAHLISPPQ